MAEEREGELRKKINIRKEELRELKHLCLTELEKETSRQRDSGLEPIKN
jgi:hypothetical protein